MHSSPLNFGDKIYAMEIAGVYSSYLMALLIYTMPHISYVYHIFQIIQDGKVSRLQN